ncbi:anti-sigma-F factor Fin [Microbacteriaceae bacterium 4G12]
MNAHYYCRHCGCKVGSIKQEHAHIFILGQLTDQEKIDMTHFDEQGILYIKTICEDCQKTLDHNPHYHEYENFLQ